MNAAGSSGSCRRKRRVADCSTLVVGGRSHRRFIAGRGFRVTGIDADPAMLAIARRKAPAGDWWLGDMRTRDLPERFGGLIGWDSFFHLTQDEQRAVLPRLV